MSHIETAIQYHHPDVATELKQYKNGAHDTTLLSIVVVLVSVEFVHIQDYWPVSREPLKRKYRPFEEIVFTGSRESCYACEATLKYIYQPITP